MPLDITKPCSVCRGPRTHKYHSYCRSCQTEYARKRYLSGKVTSKAEVQRQYYERLRQETYAAYGGRCTCCGEDRVVFLTLDHVNNDGAQHRAAIGAQHRGGGLRLYNWVRRNNYPDTIQLLCRNCNWAKHAAGRCPHQG